MTTETETPIEQPSNQPTDTGALSEVDQLKAQLAEKDADLLAIANAVLQNIPDGLKALIPDDLTPAAQVKWFNKAQAAGLLVKPQVPETDTRKPSVITPKVDLNQLPPIARMSYGYGNK